MVDFNTSAPLVVRRAIYTLCAALGLVLLSGLVEYWQMPTELTVVGDTTLALSNLFIVLLALAANIVFLRLRMNWARYLLAGLFILGLPSVLSSMFKAFHSSRVLGILDLAQIGAEASALYFLFTAPAKEWFEGE